MIRRHPPALVLALLLTGPVAAQVPATQPAEEPWTIPVLVVRYFPVLPDGQTIDLSVTSNVKGTAAQLRDRCDKLTGEVIDALEQGSRFRAYRNADAKPSLRYKVLDTREYLEPLPLGDKKHGQSRLPGYGQIMERVGIKDYVENRGVKEVWLWGYHSPTSGLWESNMASPFGDVSNSDRDPKDLPVFSKTYTVYHYNYQRGVSEAVEDHMHQIEAVMRHVGGELWKSFEGRRGAWRAGNCHFPPNGRKDYDWANKEFVQSDIEDWKPEGFGQMQALNCDRWNSSSLQWFIYWMRSIPGANNGLTYQGKPLTNWWVFIGDYDGARREKIGFVQP